MTDLNPSLRMRRQKDAEPSSPAAANGIAIPKVTKLPNRFGRLDGRFRFHAISPDKGLKTVPFIDCRRFTKAADPTENQGCSIFAEGYF
jgi:hypothetical protein